MAKVGAPSETLRFNDGLCGWAGSAWCAGRP